MQPWLSRRPVAERIAEDFAGFLERRRGWLLAAFSVAYFALTCRRASLTLLESDELYTVAVARLSGIREIWGALAAGSDGHPPLNYLAVRACEAVLGQGSLAARLPAIAGFWLMAICIFVFVSRRWPAVFGFLAMLFATTTAAYEMAYYARPYGLALGLGAASLVCWQRAAEGGRRALWLGGMAVALALALFSHFYAVALFLPVAAGEFALSISKRRIDPSAWIAMAIGALPLATMLPIIRAGQQYAGHFWGRPHVEMLMGSYQTLLAPAVVPVAMGLVMAAVLIGFGLIRPAGEEAPGSGLPGHELAAVIVSALLAFFVFALARVVTKAYVANYPVPMVIGLSILFSIAVARHRWGFPLSAVLVICLALWSASQAMLADVLLRNEGAEDAAVYSDGKYGLGRYESLPASLPRGSENLPLAVSDSHEFTSMTYYAPPGIRSRLLYLTDPDAAVQYVGFDTDERLIAALGPRAHWRFEPYGTFVQAPVRFLVLAGDSGNRLRSGWLLPKLLADGARINLVSRWEGRNIYEVAPAAR